MASEHVCVTASFQEKQGQPELWETGRHCGIHTTNAALYAGACADILPLSAPLPSGLI
jgi:hypothetical protein